MDFSGIYMIENTVTGSIYIGQAQNIKYRMRKHFEALRANKHRNSKLQNAFNKYGESAFTVHVLNENVPLDQLDDYEQTWLDMIREYPKDRVYNLCFVPSTTTGYKFTETQKLEQSKRLLGHKKTESAKKNIGSATKRKWEQGIMRSKPRKVFSVVSPDGTIYDVKGLSGFAAQYNLNAGMLSIFVSKKIVVYKGWTLFNIFV